MGNYLFHVGFMHTCIKQSTLEGHKYKQKEVAWNWMYYCNQKRRERPQNTHGYPSDLPGPYYIHSKPRTLCCFLDLLRLKDYCAEPHNATSDHTDGPSEPHVSHTKTIRHVASDWTSTMHLHSQTSWTDTIRLHKSTSCLLFHRKHSDSTSFQTLAII